MYVSPHARTTSRISFGQVTPLFALPNSYGCGLTDWDCSSMYAKLALFVFAAWAGVEVRAPS
jgi:hypothetical protein